jgi:hypothetical protein
MSDIVENLRQGKAGYQSYSAFVQVTPTHLEAANEIERLQAENARLRDAPAPETKTLRDEFADTALKAMLTRHADFPLAMARNAYEYADAMMEARKK